MPGQRDQGFEITYAGYAVGGDSGRPLSGYHVLEDGYVTARIAFDFVLRDFTTQDDLNTAALAAEAAFRTPRADCTIANGTGSPRKSLGATGNTGFDSDPQIRKVGSPKFDTSWSQLFHVEIAFGRPADNVGTSGRRTSTMNVAYDPARRRTVTIEGTYTAVPSGSTARAQYEAQIAAYVTAKLAEVGVSVYDFLEEPETRENATNKTIDFRRVIRENLHDEAGLGQDPELIGSELTVYVINVAPGDTIGARRLAQIGVDFSTWVDADLNRDLVGKWDSILAGLMTEAQHAFADGPVGLISCDRRFDWMANRITAHLELQGIYSGLLESRVTTTSTIISGQTLDPAWVDGQPMAKYLFQGPAQIQVKETRVELRSAGGGSSGGSGGGAGFGVGFGGIGGAPRVTFNGVGAGRGGIQIGGQGEGGGGAGGGAAVGGANSDVPEVAAPFGAIDPTAAYQASPQTRTITVTPIRRGLSGYSFDVIEVTIETMTEFYLPIASPASFVKSGRSGRAG